MSAIGTMKKKNQRESLLKWLERERNITDLVYERNQNDTNTYSFSGKVGWIFKLIAVDDEKRR